MSSGGKFRVFNLAVSRTAGCLGSMDEGGFLKIPGGAPAGAYADARSDRGLRSPDFLAPHSAALKEATPRPETASEGLRHQGLIKDISNRHSERLISSHVWSQF